MRSAWIILPVLFLPTVVTATEMIGQGKYVPDGDTFELAMSSHSQMIHICGIDAPESGQPGSREAWKKLSELVYGKTVSCVQVNQPPGTVCDRRSKPTNRDRVVAQCFVDGRDIAAELVQAGVACDWVRFSGGYYQRFGKACSK